MMEFSNRVWDPVDAKYASLDFPEWEQGPIPLHFWDDPENRRRFWKWFAKRLGIKKQDDWYKIKRKDFYEHNGRGLYNFYENKMDAFRQAFPKKQWHEWKFHNVSRGFWDDPNNLKAYINWLERQLKIRCLDDWYQVRRSTVIKKYYGQTAVRRNGGSLYHLLCNVYPEHQWYPWKFHETSPKFWGKKKNRIVYLKWLEKELNFKKPSDWYQIKGQDFFRNYGRRVMNSYYRFDYVKMAKEIYPKENWMEWKFAILPNGFWDDRSNCRRFIAWLKQELGLKKMEDWYQVTREEVKAKNGGVMIRSFRSISAALAFAYPKNNWMPWKFPQVPPHYWEHLANRKKYLKWLGNQLKFTSKKEWNRLTVTMLIDNFGSSLRARFALDQLIKEGKSTV